MLAMLAKAEAHAEAKSIDPSALLEARLRPDMFSFTGQIEMIGGSTYRGIARLMGNEPTSVEAPKADFAALKAYILGAQKCVQEADGAAIDANAETSFAVDFGPTIKMQFTGHSYAFAFLLPNTMFHVSTAYAILRERGVELGKIDLLGSFVGQFGVTPVA